jgi:hypothetical protein
MLSARPRWAWDMSVNQGREAAALAALTAAGMRSREMIP